MLTPSISALIQRAKACIDAVSDRDFSRVSQ